MEAKGPFAKGWPSRVMFHSPETLSRFVKSKSFCIRILDSWDEDLTSETETGCARYLCSSIPGCGIRSDETIPSHTKFASCSVSPKSPP